MRTLLRARLDTHTANEAIRNGTMPEHIQTMLDKLRPEAAYFTTMDGGRSCLFVFDLQDPSQLPGLVETLFLELEAEVEVHPVMNVDDLRKGMSELKPG
ncbi:hypothetical protein ACWD4B_29470 [Streptomyces sp. NPDC002536]